MNKYQKALLAPTDQVNLEEIQFQSQQAELQLQADELSTKKKLSEAKKQLELAKGASPLVSEVIVKAHNEVESLAKGLALLQELRKELFTELPAETPATEAK